MGRGEISEKWAAPPTLVLSDLKASPSGHFEHLPHPFFGLRRAFEVTKGTDAVGHIPAFLGSNWLLLHLGQLSSGVFVLPKVLLVSHQDDGHIGAEVLHLWGPLFRDVFQAVGAVNGETHEDDVGVRVGQRPKAVIVFLAGCVPKCQLHLLAIHLYVSDIVLEDSRDINFRKLVLAEHNEETGLPAGSIPYNHQLLADGSHGRGWQRTRKGILRKMARFENFSDKGSIQKGEEREKKEGLLGHVFVKNQLFKEALELEIPNRVRDSFP